jgi:hypothetical protein
MDGRDTLNVAQLDGDQLGQVGELVPEGVRKDPAFLVGGLVAWFAYRHRDKLGAIIRRLRGGR